MVVRLRPFLIHSFCVAALITLSYDAHAQGQAVRITSARVVPAQPTLATPATPVDSANGAVPNAENQPPAEEVSPEKNRLDLLLAAKFDRTTQAVLKAWSDRTDGNKEKKESAGETKVWKAKTVNAFEDFVVFQLEANQSAIKPDQTLVIQQDEKEIGRAKVIRVKNKQVVATLVPIKKEASEAATLENKDDADPGAAKGEAPKSSESDEESDESDEPAGSDEKGEKAIEGGAETEQTGTPAPAEPAVELPKISTGDSVTLSIDPDKLPATSIAKKTAKEEVDAFVRAVTLGNWNHVKGFLAAMKPEDASKVYAHLLNSLATATPKTPDGVPPEVAAQMASQMRQQGQTPPTVHLSPQDILQLSEASPEPIQISLQSNNRVSIEGGDGISGKWKGRLLLSDVAQEMRSFDLVMKWDGQTVTGSMTANAQTLQINGGTYDKDSGEISVTLSGDGQTARFSGTISDGKLTGSISADGISMEIEAEMIEADGDVVVQEKDDAAQVASSNTVPANIKLPPGVKFEDLPAEAQEQLRNAAGTSSESNKKSGNSEHIASLARLIRNSHKAGHDFSDFVQQIEKGTTHFGSDNPIKRLTAADLMMKAGMNNYVEQFLPKLDDEATKTNLPALKLWSRLALAMFAKKRVAEWLERAWTINQAIVAMEDANKTDKDAALSNLIELSSQIEKEIGAEWLNASFSDEPERGMRILTNLGTKSATMASRAAQTSEQQRIKLLRLQNEAVESLLRISPETAEQWNQAITLLAQNWLTEAETSIQFSKQNSRREFMQIDMYGNYYWVDEDDYMRRFNNQRRPRPIKIGDMLEVAPSPTWRKLVGDSLQTQFRKVLANLHLRVNEEDKAFPYIEEIAPKHPAIARDLVHEFLRIWTKNHDPNTDKRQRNPYIYMYGFDQKAEAIPLTRSKQERNLMELAGWVDRIRKMPIDDIDESLLANAFTTCHSSAEVFDLDRVRSVFGELGQLKPETVAALCQKMRNNLASNWRDIRQQEAKQTKRREPEVQKEVLRGYSVAMQLAAEAIESSPDNWQLHLARACLMYDKNAYSQSVKKSSEFSDRRDAAFEQFQFAATKYTDIASTLEENDQSTDVFDYWFYASLGACDLGKITDKTVPDLRQYKKIRAAMEQMPVSLSESHMSKFANNLFTRMSPIKPEIKFRYLRGGFEIVGDHPRAWEARNLYDYYKDLVSEIKLDVMIDGDDSVGHEQAFGLYVNLLHTPEIERESGGFGKYVQNQNNLMYAYKLRSTHNGLS